MEAFTFRLVTQEGTTIDSDQVTGVTAPGSEGWLGVLAGHAPMVCVLKNGWVSVEIDGAKQYFVIDEGVLQVKRSETVMLVDYAEPVSGPQEAAQVLASGGRKDEDAGS